MAITQAELELAATRQRRLSEQVGFDVLPQDFCKHPAEWIKDFGLGPTCELCYKVLLARKTDGSL